VEYLRYSSALGSELPLEMRKSMGNELVVVDAQR
jgi:hypothetical protein